FADLAEMLADGTEKTVGQASTIAATSQSTFYRTIQARQFEDADPAGKFKYRYAGPDDKFTRPFCEHQLQRKNPLTQAEIEQLDNGQLPNPFVTGGGFNCRHQWILDTASAMRAAA